MAATGLLTAVLWISGVGVLLATGIGTGTFGFLFGIGLLCLSLVIPTAFSLGCVLWRRYDPEENRRVSGALYGGITELGSLGVEALGATLLLVISNVASGQMAVSDGLVFVVLLVPAGFIFAVVAAEWLVRPLGIFGGWYHEHAKSVP
jgi:hypothetical protein